LTIDLACAMTQFCCVHTARSIAEIARKMDVMLTLSAGGRHFG